MKHTVSLCGAWEMRRAGDAEWISAVVPGSVYADLMRNGKMEDPFWRDNETQALALMDEDYEYRRAFTLTESDLSADRLLVRCEGVDTLAEFFINGVLVQKCDNMHRVWEFDIKDVGRAGENELLVRFFSPVRYMHEKFEELPLGANSDSIRGFPHLRKASCMSGWDWGPRLPDAGLWRDISLVAVDRARLLSVLVLQEHDEGGVTLSFEPEIERVFGCEHCDTGYSVRYTVTAPNGEKAVSVNQPIAIDHPLLWWPRGYGEQPLYEVLAELIFENRVLDTWNGRIGLRTMAITRKPDQWGESFAATVNGVMVFCMGADYIPEDNILSRVNAERTRRLIEDCALANYNCVRVWGGGYYPDDFFFDACDELGIMVWQDFMFACVMYRQTEAFRENIAREFVDNVRRLRHHASLMLWCGNNEIEELCASQPDLDPQLWVDYIRMFEDLIPSVVRKMSPQTDYWPSSPSCGVTGMEANDPNRGDVHFWAVWHANKPFTEYRKFFFRFASEFGFQSFPCRKTIESFTLEEDRNIFSYVMEKHQRNNAANGKIMNYMSATFLYPTSFDTLIYASQLMQMEAIRYGVEHWRRNRGRCMGAIYWQINDCWPVASWSSIDYIGRWKALHYAARRFFAPVLLSCEEEGVLTQNTNVNAEPFHLVKSARLNLSNETMRAVRATVAWALRSRDGRTVRAGESDITVDALSAVWLDTICFDEADPYTQYVSYEMRMDGQTVSGGTALFVAPKHFRFSDPKLSLNVRGNEITVSADAYARSVEIICEDGDVVLSDNYFDLNADSRTVRILRGEGRVFSVRSVYDIR